jgi:predicted HTH domain antitoxin
MSSPAIRVQDLVEAGLYEDETQAVQAAVSHLLQDRPDLRFTIAVHRYRIDEELTLAQAAAIAGVSLERMKELLEQRGVPLRLGPASVQEARAELATLGDWHADPH